jgi:hypothetical protein
MTSDDAQRKGQLRDVLKTFGKRLVTEGNQRALGMSARIQLSGGSFNGQVREPLRPAPIPESVIVHPDGHIVGGVMAGGEDIAAWMSGGPAGHGDRCEHYRQTGRTSDAGIPIFEHYATDAEAASSPASVVITELPDPNAGQSS